MALSPFLSIPPIVRGCAEIVHPARATAGGVAGPIMRREEPASARAGPGEVAMATTVIGRPKTLEESKDYLRRRLAERQNPMIAQDAEAASAAIDRLESLDPDHWAAVWAEVGARFERDAQAAEARDDAAAADAAYFQAYAFYFLGRFPCPNTP